MDTQNSCQVIKGNTEQATLLVGKSTLGSNPQTFIFGELFTPFAQELHVYLFPLTIQNSLLADNLNTSRAVKSETGKQFITHKWGDRSLSTSHFPIWIKELILFTLFTKRVILLIFNLVGFF